MAAPDHAGVVAAAAAGHPRGGEGLGLGEDGLRGDGAAEQVVLGHRPPVAVGAAPEREFGRQQPAAEERVGVADEPAVGVEPERSLGPGGGFGEGGLGADLVEGAGALRVGRRVGAARGGRQQGPARDLGGVGVVGEAEEAQPVAELEDRGEGRRAAEDGGIDDDPRRGLRRQGGGPRCRRQCQAAGLGDDPGTGGDHGPGRVAAERGVGRGEAGEVGRGRAPALAAGDEQRLGLGEEAPAGDGAGGRGGRDRASAAAGRRRGRRSGRAPPPWPAPARRGWPRPAARRRRPPPTAPG